MLYPGVRFFLLNIYMCAPGKLNRIKPRLQRKGRGEVGRAREREEKERPLQRARIEKRQVQRVPCAGQLHLEPGLCETSCRSSVASASWCLRMLPLTAHLDYHDFTCSSFLSHLLVYAWFFMRDEIRGVRMICMKEVKISIRIYVKNIWPFEHHIGNVID